MNLDKGMIYACVPQGDIERGFLCTSAQFDEKYVSPHDQLLAQFNKLAAKVDAIYEELRPAKLDKNGLKKPEDDSP
jgi:hypothetical protein